MLYVSKKIVVYMIVCLRMKLNEKNPEASE